jgi:hypothetical protein
VKVEMAGQRRDVVLSAHRYSKRKIVGPGEVIVNSTGKALALSYHNEHISELLISYKYIEILKRKLSPIHEVGGFLCLDGTLSPTFPPLLLDP